MKRERRKLTGRELQSIATPGLVRRVVRPKSARPLQTDEEVLKAARIALEVPAAKARALPDRPRFRKLLEAWREKREGRDPGILAFAGPTEPDERPMFAYAPRQPSPLPRLPTFLELWRKWGWHNLADAYEKELGKGKGPF